MQLNLNTGTGKIPEIYSGSSVFQEMTTWLQNHSNTPDSIFILTDTNTRKYCLNALINELPALGGAIVLEIEAGERNKSLESATCLWNELSVKGASRNSLLINLGGGMITDLGGFVASTFKRGIPFVHVPTSLLGMVDAAIGGKTGINFGDSKNQVGLFRNPDAIFISTGFLKTLDPLEVLSGISEIFKIALVADASLWEKLRSIRIEDQLIINPGNTIWEELINASILIKCRVVEQDFRDHHIREILNFGHTIGHAFESLALHKNEKLSHGHSVALGMICESYLSVKKAGLDENSRDEIVQRILPIFPHYHLDDKDLKLIMDFMIQDKKRRAGEFRFSLLDSPGKAIQGVPFGSSEIIDSINFYRTFGG